MLVHVAKVLSPEQVAYGRRLLDAAEWIDGRVTAGHQSSRVKDNSQIPEGHPAARELGELIVHEHAVRTGFVILLETGRAE